MAAIKYDFTKGDVAQAINADVNATFANAKNVWTITRRYVELNAQGKLPASEARRLLVARRAALQKKYADNHDTRKVADISDPRVSEMAGILRLGEWKCWPAAFDAIKSIDVNLDTVNTVSKIVRGAVKGKEAKASADSCPTRESIIREIIKRKASRRGKDGKKNGNGKGTKSVRDPLANLGRIQAEAAALARYFKGEKGAVFIANIIKAVASAKAEARVVVKARKAEAAAEAAA
jgi:hypothetical protein